MANIKAYYILFIYRFLNGESLGMFRGDIVIHLVEPIFMLVELKDEHMHCMQHCWQTLLPLLQPPQRRYHQNFLSDASTTVPDCQQGLALTKNNHTLFDACHLSCDEFQCD